MKNGRCKMHGGKTPNGVASPNWKNGRWAGSLKNIQLRQKFYDALADPHLTHTVHSIALTDAMLANQLEFLPTKKAIPWEQVRQITALQDARERLVASLQRQQRESGRVLVMAQFLRVIDEMVATSTKLMVRDDGSPNLDARRQWQVVLERLANEYLSIEGEVVREPAAVLTEGDGNGGDDDGSGT